MKITSPTFNEGEEIPSKYTCDGRDISPPLKIKDLPADTRSIALIVEDPDAPGGTFIHWMLWNISPDSIEIKEGEKPEEALRGENDFDKKEWGGPCPPSGTHRYFFKVFALRNVLDLSPSSSRKELKQAMKGQIMKKAQLKGVYEKE